ncbi:uncharacterized protein [Miscanthus floridulus]|uniref:uncharacterized protein n=1 Tax=Miscanthus floridulus TaxID=154761 RepID=UPI0034574957
MERASDDTHTVHRRDRDRGVSDDPPFSRAVLKNGGGSGAPARIARLAFRWRARHTWRAARRTCGRTKAPGPSWSMSIPRRTETEGDRARARYNCRARSPRRTAWGQRGPAHRSTRSTQAAVLRAEAETWGGSRARAAPGPPAWPACPQPSTRVPSPRSKRRRPPAISPLHPPRQASTTMHATDDPRRTRPLLVQRAHGSATAGLAACGTADPVNVTLDD